MSEYAIEMRNQLVGLFGIVERNVYLTKRYFLWDIAFMVWTIANTLTIVYIARSPGVAVDKQNAVATAFLTAPVAQHRASSSRRATGAVRCEGAAYSASTPTLLRCRKWQQRRGEESMARGAPPFLIPSSGVHFRERRRVRVEAVGAAGCAAPRKFVAARDWRGAA